MKTINNRLMNRFYMVLNVLAFLKEWLVKFKDNTDYQSYVDELEDRVGQMQVMEEDLSALRTPMGSLKAAVLKEYNRAMRLMVDSLNEVALSLSSSELSNYIRLNRRYIGGGTDQNRLLVGRKFLEYAEIYQQELAQLNKGTDTVIEAEKALQAYEAISQLPIQRKKKASALLENYEALLDQTIHLIRINIRPFFAREQMKYPEAYALLQDFMNIPEHGKRSAKKKEESAAETATKGSSNATAPTPANGNASGEANAPTNNTTNG